MKAWQFIKTGEPLQLAEVPEPKAGPGEVVIDMKAAGLCHSDVGLLEDEGWLSLLAKTPITIGHENAGVVAEVGEGVTDFQVGDRVGVCPTADGVGAPGYGFDGGFAPKMAVDARALVPLPDGVDFANGAAATDAGMTSYAALVRQGGAKKGDTVGIIGLGGLGQIAARVAVLMGCEVYVAEINEDVWKLAREIGAKDVRKSIADFADVTFDLIVDYAGFGTTTAQAVDGIRRDGTVVVAGMGRLEATISTKSLILNQCRLIGSNGGTKEDVAGVYEYMATGKLNPQLTKISFEEIPEGIDKLRQGKVVGRLIAVYE
ncbi:zinc-binding dehydrogenase [Actinobaculum suis]|uniref:zinc-binding dehydrogenase n=1 Tax=Actinobaculum suis TaxID=1657 RepID=UPI00080871DA|nr:zinc-binding dehydrogenase [Actinobaculum suis]OCA94620.1 alcohol dehydrogenase [Actinobaculum suis]OCA94932.1 alcohol dehydrogenase [Actinobaculum suis]